MSLMMLTIVRGDTSPRRRNTHMGRAHMLLHNVELSALGVGI